MYSYSVCIVHKLSNYVSFPQNTKSVKEALEAYVRRDKVEGLTCSRSNQEVPAWQEVQLEELPPVLLLHLKWFDYSQDGCSKKLKTIHYDIDLKVESSKFDL